MIHFTFKASHFSINSSTEISKRSVPPSWTPQTHFAIALPNRWISNQAQKLPSKTTSCHFYSKKKATTKLNSTYRRHSNHENCTCIYTVISTLMKELAKISVENSRWLFCTEHVPVEHCLIILLHSTFGMHYVDDCEVPFFSFYSLLRTDLQLCLQLIILLTNVAYQCLLSSVQQLVFTLSELLLLNGSMKSRVPPKTSAVPIQCCTVNGLLKSSIDDIKLINFRMKFNSQLPDRLNRLNSRKPGKDNITSLRGDVSHTDSTAFLGLCLMRRRIPKQMSTYKRLLFGDDIYNEGIKKNHVPWKHCMSQMCKS
ncbi:hypothetical protein T11_9721 [Trichinella zimbabwensis]|uniref:Uncharacterized protein n=1 Tax=Trichinella zimbabwensis TaxID=268475 RepID=A0A0V1H5Y8_9BILA|nr:hypothetical protein T11_9721 [Trichinella zimbabwensis]